MLAIFVDLGPTNQVPRCGCFTKANLPGGCPFSSAFMWRLNVPVAAGIGSVNVPSAWAVAWVTGTVD